MEGIMSSRQRTFRALRSRRKRSIRLALENLEDRLVLSNVQLNYREYHAPGTYPSWMTPSPLGILPFDFGSSTPVGYTPQQIRTAYSLNNITFGGVQGDGTGQTIAIVDAYDDPSFVDSTDSNFSSSDLAQFDQTFGLADPPSFTKYNELGQTTNLPGTDPAGAGNLNGNWEVEEALDIEWAHAIAPGASIDLVEASSTSNNALFTAVSTAARLPGVSVVSMSWGLDEFNGEQSIDSTFTTPSSHPGVTFVAATGDSGSPGYYPAYSPNVVAAGGTTLPLDAQGDYPGTGPNGEVGWSGSGGGTSQFETEPAYQQGVQSTGFRTIPDVAWDADANTGVAVYDSYNNTDNSGPWQQIGGTSVAAPSWAGLFAIANQGRVGAGGATLNSATDPTMTLTALYSLPSNDFNDILYGNNGSGSTAGFNAGPGYDEVTGLGTPKANLLVPDLLAYGAASKLVVTAQPPGNVIVGNSFGVEVSAEDGYGYVDSAYNGTLTLSLADNPGSATLGGTLTAQAKNGVAVFDGLTLNKTGTGYAFQISSPNLPTVTTSTFDVTPNPTPWAGTFYPVPIDSSLRADITAANSNIYAVNTIVLADATYLLTDATAGQLVIQNTSSLPSKTLTIVGQGESSSIIEPGITTWNDRIFEVVGTSGVNLTVVFQNLSIEGGNATTGGILGGTAALGGGLLIDGGTVSLTKVTFSNNQAAGAAGPNGAAGAAGLAGGDGGTGQKGRGGAIYLAAGNVTLNSDTINQNLAKAGAGGNGGAGASGKNAQASLAKTGALGRTGGTGGTAAGGGVYVAGGQLIVSNDTFSQNQAIGGAGGIGGSGGIGGLNKPGGAGGVGGPAGAAAGGAVYLAQGSLTLTVSTLQNNSAIGGAGGQGGSGGLGGAANLPSGSIGSILGGSGFVRRGGDVRATTRTIGAAATGNSGVGGNGGAGGDGAVATGGGLYVAGGVLTLSSVTLDGNQAIGGEGGQGGPGGIGGLKPSGGGTGLPVGEPGGTGGNGGHGASGQGGGLYVGSGTVTVMSTTFSGNTARGGQGGSGGAGGSGYIAAVFGGGMGGTGIATGGGGTGSGGTGSGSGGHGGTGINTAGPGGNGGNGAAGQGGGLYISGGTVTLINDTVAGNTAQVGPAGMGGPGGHAGTGKLTGGAGQAGSAGNAQGGGLYVSGGSVSLFNSTVADNFVDTSGGSGTSGGLGGGLNISEGTVFLESTIIALNTSGTKTKSTADDITGTAVSTGSYNLIGTGGSGGLTSSNHNQVDIGSPALDALAGNGGLTRTIALQAGRPAIRAGANPEKLVADQRGYSVPAGTLWDVGAYQTSAVADTTPPMATLQATSVTSSNAGSLDPYTFSITFSDNVAVSAVTLPGALVQVIPPAGTAITATVVTTSPVGSTDALGNAQEFVVTYQITPPGGTWALADNGTYTVTLGGAPVTDLAGNAVTPGTVGTFSVQINSNELVVTGQPNGTVAAGTPFSMTVTVENSQGAVQAGFNGSVTIALANNPSDSTLNGNLTIKASGGVATFSGLTLDTAANGYTIDATSTGLTSVMTNAFDVTPAAASQLLVTTQPPGTVTAGTTFGLTLTAEDRYDNVATEFTGIVAVAFKSNPGGATLGGPVSLNATAGVAAFAGLTLDTAANGYTIQATSTGLTSAITNSFDVTPAAASQLVVTTQPLSPVTAGSTFGLTVTAEDPYGNVATPFTGSVAVALKSNPSGGTLGGTVSLNATAAVAAFSNLTLDTAANGYTIQATSTGLTSATTNTFDVTPAAASQLLVTTQPPGTVTAGTTFGLTITAEDRYDNVATGFTGSVAVALKSNPGGGTLAGTVSLNASAGVAAFSSLTLDTAANGYTIQAASTGLTSAITNSFDVTPAAASQLLITTQPLTPITAGTTFGLTVTAEDPYGNVATAFTGSVGIALKSNPGGGTLAGTLSLNATSAVATFSGLTLDTVANGYTIQATSTGLTSATTNAFDVTPAAASQLLVTTQPPGMVTAGSTFGLTATAEDAYGNVATGFAGKVTVALKSNPGGGTLTGTVSLNATAGVAAFTGLTLDTAASGYTIQATSSGLTSVTTNSFDVTLAPASQLLVTTQPLSTVTAGAGFGLTVTAEDRYGNVATDFTGIVAIALKSNSGGGTLTGTVSLNATAGVAAFANLTVDTAANGYTIQATSTGLTSAMSNSFDVTPAAASQLVITTQPSTTVTAGSPFGLTVTAEDRYGNVATAFTGSVAVALKSNPGSSTLNGTVSLNATAGAAPFFNLTLDTAADGYTIQVTSTGLTGTTSDSFDVAPAVALQLLVTTQPLSTVTAGGTFGLTVTADDRYGNVATEFTGSVAIAFKSNPGRGTLGGTVGLNAAAGVAAFAGLTLDRAANGYTIQAVSSGLTSATTNSFNVTPAAASQLVVATQPPTTIPVHSPFGLAVSAEDPYGNVVTTMTGAVTVSLKKKAGGAKLGGKRTVALSGGVATFSGLTVSNTGKGYQIQATKTGLLPTVTNPFTVTAAKAKLLRKATRPTVQGQYRKK